MANIDRDEMITKFLLDSCQAHSLTFQAIKNLTASAPYAIAPPSPVEDEVDAVPLTTGSVAEFYILRLLSCVGDIDVMYYFSCQLAIPAGTAPPTQLPDEFHSLVEVYEIVDSKFPGYVYLVASYLLTECIDDDKYMYNAVQCPRQYVGLDVCHDMHGPAITSSFMSDKPAFYLYDWRDYITSGTM